jgi:uncharacterized membrane protein
MTNYETLMAIYSTIVVFTILGLIYKKTKEINSRKKTSNSINREEEYLRDQIKYLERELFEQKISFLEKQNSELKKLLKK